MARIEFQNAGIEDMARGTTQQSQMWDEIWRQCYQMLSSTAGYSMDSAVGTILEARNAEYNQKSAAYQQQVAVQGTVGMRVASTAREFHGDMRSIMGSA